VTGEPNADVVSACSAIVSVPPPAAATPTVIRIAIGLPMPKLRSCE
jgi:hypothetical protein